MRCERCVDCWSAVLVGRREDHTRAVTVNARDIPASTRSEGRSASRSRCARMEFPVPCRNAPAALQHALSARFSVCDEKLTLLFCDWSRRVSF